MPMTKEQWVEYSRNRRANMTEEQKEKIKAQQRERYKKKSQDPEFVKNRREKRMERYHNVSKEQEQEKQKEYRANHKEEMAEYNKAYKATEKGLKKHRITGWKQLGVVSDDWDLLYEKYINTTNCEHCDVELVEGKVGNNAKHLDHDHKTGLFRAVLCKYCNTEIFRCK